MEDETFTVAISIGNDAMQSPEDVARALRTIADKLERRSGALGWFQTIHDDNGNDVGRWKYGYSDRTGSTQH